MRDHRDEMSGAAVVVVTFADAPERLAAYRRHLDLVDAGIPVLADPDRALYRILDAGRGSLWRIWSPGTLALYARLLRDGRRLERPEDDLRQLGADLVVDRAGRIHRLWLPSGPDRRPPVSELIDAAREVGAR